MIGAGTRPRSRRWLPRNSETFNLTGMGDPEQVSGSNVSSSLFGVLRVTPFLGRLFTEEDDHPTAAPVVVISYASWRGRFHADPAILGRMIVLDGVPRAIVGVLPPGVRYPVTDSRGEVFSPLGLLESNLAGRANRSVTVLGRLKPGVPLRQAQADLDRVAGRLAIEYPATNRDVRARMERYADRVTASSAALLRALWGAVMLVWFVACANAAGLVAIRNASRAREFATRLSLGATRARLSAQVLTESLALATVAGSLGVIAAGLALPVLVTLLPSDLPRVADIALDGRVLGYAGLCTLVTAVLAALLAGLAHRATAALPHRQCLRANHCGEVRRPSRTRHRSIGAVPCAAGGSRLVDDDPGAPPPHGHWLSARSRGRGALLSARRHATSRANASSAFIAPSSTASRICRGSRRPDC